MATVRERHSNATGRTTYAVLFRHGGRQSSVTFETPKAAGDFKKLVEILGADKALATLEDEPDGITVSELFERWIEWKASTDVTARTLKDYRRDYTNWIAPRLGNRTADTVDELDVQQWVDGMVKRGADPKSIGDRHMILGSMFKFGVAKSRRLVTQNPCLETQLPSKKRKPPKGFTLAQWSAMHQWAEVHEPDADDLLAFLASTGWRFSEATAMTPAGVEDHGDQAVRLEDGTQVVIPVVYVSVLGVHRLDEHYQTVYVEGVAKSRAGVRRINLNPSAAHIVRRRMTNLAPGDLLFTNPRGKRWHSTNFIQREFQRILDGAGIEKVDGMGPHYLRHTQVGMLDRAGASASKMQRRVGHESITTTLGVYGGMIDNALSPTELLKLDAQVVGSTPANAVTAPTVAGEVVS